MRPEGPPQSTVSLTYAMLRDALSSHREITASLGGLQDPSMTDSDSTLPSPTAATATAPSANSAQTLDAIASLRAKLAAARATVTKVDKLEGDAHIVVSRGKKRFLLDYSFVLSWRIEVSHSSCLFMLACQGTLLVSETCIQITRQYA